MTSAQMVKFLDGQLKEAFAEIARLREYYDANEALQAERHGASPQVIVRLLDARAALEAGK